ncbi:hypothetical protein KC247_00275 [Staphylococcus aureus]|uniref:hypothetical protein n=1 Tax=Staphylococcus aureus TaxID=1280 RepID=UPI00202E643C|nr:hypothetical protein [Staphylococcus aureus]MCM0462192.1 hypothetical protein [Staphylococcus aureus]MCM0493372.1 hypothetical protein [Staphylococcus aureus]MCM0503776.1 hypothetical protein [Staphylococcus aureus]MCM0506425.1 hypothetical protein [Staphylococcus aureus]MCM0509073.1 hypothetical protein [Staphylococcus aureus]
MKIKVKKEMRLDELIKWAWENPELVAGKRFHAEYKYDENYVFFPLHDGRKCLISDFISADDTFEVEVEEKITEETKFDRLFEVFEYLEGQYDCESNVNISINERLKDKCFPIESFYILNDDLTMTLIWKDGELVV